MSVRTPQQIEQKFDMIEGHVKSPRAAPTAGGLSRTLGVRLMPIVPPLGSSENPPHRPGTVLLSDKLAEHPATRLVGNLAVAAWVESICWCSRNGRVDHFPVTLARQFGTAKVEARLVAADMWIEWSGHYVIPKRAGCSGVDMWKFGPANTYRPHIPNSLRFAVYERDNYTCLHCGTSEQLSLDHIHPYSLGGKDTRDNLQTLCRPCNSRKGARV